MSSSAEQVQQNAAVCPNGYRTSKTRPGLCLQTGFLVGVISAILAEFFGYLPSGHQLNDPILLSLSLGTVFRGLLYFRWMNLLIPAGYAALLGIASIAVLKVAASRSSRRVTAQDADRTSKLAVIVSSIPVLLTEIDAVQVLLWYGIAVWISVLIASFVSRQMSRI